MLALFTPIVIRVNGITFLDRKMWRTLLQEEVQQKNLKSLGGLLVLSSYERIRYQSSKLPPLLSPKRINNEKVREFLLQNDCDFSFRMNAPSASHMGGVWERMIRSVYLYTHSLTV